MIVMIIIVMVKQHKYFKCKNLHSIARKEKFVFVLTEIKLVLRN